MIGGVQGDDEPAVYAELCRVVDEWIAVHRQEGIPLPPSTAGKEYSGKLVVLLGKELHRDLAIRALREGKSLNSYCVSLLRPQARGYGFARTRAAAPPA